MLPERTSLAGLKTPPPPPPARPRNWEGPPKWCKTQPDSENCLKNLLNLGRQHHQDVRGKKGGNIPKLPPVRNCFTLAMTNKLVVIINSLKVLKN
jgi:hypothetical protein